LPSVNDDRTALGRMLDARSVALVGASVKEGSLGHQMVVELVRGGYRGAIYPVNPNYGEVLGLRCFPDIAAVPEPPDMVILGVSNARIERAISEAVAAGAKSAVTFSSLYEDRPTGAGVPPLSERIAAVALEAGIPLCGGNGMGFLNLESNLRATGFATPDEMRPGPVTFISHSGSAFAAFAFNKRRIGFNLIVSSGQEIVTGLADYMEYALGLATTRVLALFIETVRDPAGFREQLARAAAEDVPVIALKVGRTEVSQTMVVAHSGALAGEDGAFEALFDSYGVSRVNTLDEMADALELFSSPRRATTGTGIASVHDSGGERALFVDVASDRGVPFAAISEVTRFRIQDLLDPGLVAANPLDAWGTGIYADRIFIESLRALSDDPDTAALALVVDLTPQEEDREQGYLKVAREAFAATSKPFCVLSNLPATVDSEEAGQLREEGIPVLEGASSGLLALRLLIERRDYIGRPELEPIQAVSPDVRSRWTARLATGDALSELEGLGLLADYGVPIIKAMAADSAEKTVAAAEAVGFPVVLKTAAPGVIHKSDVGGVLLGLGDRTEVANAYEDLSRRLGPHVVVAATAPRGAEVAFGIVHDPQFGPLVLVAAGGVFIELLDDRRLALPPLDERRARKLIDGLFIRRLLDDMRGEGAADIGALARALSRLSVLAEDLGDSLDALDVNPVVVSADGCVAVDAAVLPRAAGPGDPLAHGVQNG
jgi:acetate---CoA ligase (ADP-forming)